MIPKIIHYCWFGGNPKSEIIKKCIESWKKYCPEYEIIEWNESNFDVNCIQYVKDAYNAKKWAFVSDYARLWVVYNYGGIYLDTDVLLKNSLDDLLVYDCFLASDDVKYINTGLGFGAEKENKIIGAVMDAYNGYRFSLTPCIILNTDILEKEWPSWKKSNLSQTIGNTLIIGVSDYGKYASHLYTNTYIDDDKEVYENRQNQIKETIYRIENSIPTPPRKFFYGNLNAS